MNSLVKGTIRFVLGAAILGAGVGIMNGLISIKEETACFRQSCEPSSGSYIAGDNRYHQSQNSSGRPC